jgi:phospholipid-binding lipoprotein MlaA
MLVLVFFAVFGFAQNHALASSDDVSVQLAQKDTDAAAAEEEDDDDEDYDDDDYEDDDVQLIADPLQQMNFDFYELNNGLYYTFLKPVAIGWKTISPEGLRMMIKNFMYNIRFPVRFINCLLQGKGQKATYDFCQFFVNSTVGLFGLADIAAIYPKLNTSPEDLGQTFAVWGIGNGFYLTLPFLGPSSARDGLGKLGDTFLDPIWWLFDDIITSVAIRAGEAVNDTSFRIGEYEALQAAALDPYVMIRNAYVQNRNKLIEE